MSIAPGRCIRMESSVVKDLTLSRGYYGSSMFLNSSVGITGDGCDLSNIRSVGTVIDILGTDISLDAGLFRQHSLPSLDLRKSSLVDFEIRDSHDPDKILRTEDVDGIDVSGLMSVTIRESNCNLFKIERSVGSVKMVSCDMTDGIFYSSVISGVLVNCNLKNVEFIDVRFTPNSVLSVPSQSTAAFKNLRSTSFVDCLLPRKFYETAVNGGARMDHVQVIPDDNDLF